MKASSVYALVAAGVIFGASFALRRVKDEGSLVLASGVAPVTTHAAPSTSEGFPISAVERQASKAIERRVGSVLEEVATIASGDQVLARRILSVAQAVQEIDHDDEELRNEAARSRWLSVAVVQSGSFWVLKK